MEQQIEDLRERMRLLQQDRRANVDLLESNKTNNTEEVRYLREENKDLRVRLSQLQRAGDESQGENQELVHAQKEVLRMRAEYDSLKRWVGWARSEAKAASVASCLMLLHIRTHRSLLPTNLPSPPLQPLQQAQEPTGQTERRRENLQP